MSDGPVKSNVMRRKLERILYKELAAANVSVRMWKRNGGGSADFNLQFVDVPRPKNPYLLGVAFHEIGHIHYYRTKKGYDELPMYELEYMAEVYAMNKLKAYGLPTREYRAYATKYVLSCCAKYKNTGGDVMKIPVEIRRWTRMEVKKWIAARRVIVENVDVNSLKDIRVTYKS